MAEKTEIGVAPWMTAVFAVVAGLYAYVQLVPALPNPRPQSGQSTPASLVGEQRFPARLWEDPVEATENQAVPRKSLDDLAESVRAYSVGEVQVLCVFVEGFKYPEDRETRLRLRYATQWALIQSLYRPADRSHLGCLETRWPSGRQLEALCKIPPMPRLDGRPVDEPDASRLAIPFEWFHEYNGNAIKSSALVLWLKEEEFADYPIRRLLQLDGALNVCTRSNPVSFKVIGPRSSDTLRAMARDHPQIGSSEPAVRHQLQLEGFSAEEFDKLLAKFEIDSPGATAPDVFILGVSAADSPNYSAENRNFLERELATNCGVRFTSLTTLDTTMAATMAEELGRRRVSPFDGTSAEQDKPTIGILYEGDTLFSRSLVNCFAALCEAAPPEGNQSYKDILSNRLLRSCDPSGLISPVTSGPSLRRCVTYAYLRGLDGSQGGADGAKPAAQDDNRSKTAVVSKHYNQEPAEGNGQFDYAGRIARELKEQVPGLEAIGIFGSDPYDKLILLQALRRDFPQALFFTKDLDNRYLLPSAGGATRNMIIVSPYPLDADELAPPNSFSESQITDLPMLARRIDEKADPVSILANQKLDGRARQELTDYRISDVRLRSSLVSALNRIASGQLIYEKSRFRDRLGKETTKLLPSQALKADTKSLNRLLLQEAYPKELAAGEAGAQAFSVSDIKDFSGLAGKLWKRADPVSSFLRTQLNAPEESALTQYARSGKGASNLARDLVRILNQIIEHEPLYNSFVFAGVRLRPGTSQLLAQNPQGRELIRLNRQLLEDAYSEEISPKFGETFAGRRIAEFRNSMQTAIFCAVCRAVGRQVTDETPPKPRLYEVGRSRFIGLPDRAPWDRFRSLAVGLGDAGSWRVWLAVFLIFVSSATLLLCLVRGFWRSWTRIVPGLTRPQTGFYGWIQPLQRNCTIWLLAVGTSALVSLGLLTWYGLWRSGQLDGAPFRLAEGVSIWPTELVRCCAFWLTILMLIYAWSEHRISRIKVFAQFINGTELWETEKASPPEARLSGLDRFGAQTLSACHLKNPRSLAQKIAAKADPVSEFVAGHLDDSGREAISALTERDRETPELCAALIRALNRALTDSTFAECSRFQTIQLPPFTANLLGRNPKGPDLLRLNLRLLREAYPGELSFSWWRQRHHCSINEWPRIDGEEVDAAELLSAYFERGRFANRLLRTIPYALLFLLIGFSLVAVLGHPTTPTRSNFGLDRWALRLTIIAFCFLAFYVVDATRLSERLINRLGDHPTSWPKPYLEKLAGNTQLREGHLAGYADVKFVALHTGEVSRLIFMPFTILCLMLLSRTQYFDRWTWPLALQLILGLSALINLVCALVVRRSARQVREDAIARLQAVKLSIEVETNRLIPGDEEDGKASVGFPRAAVDPMPELETEEPVAPGLMCDLEAVPRRSGLTTLRGSNRVRSRSRKDYSALVQQAIDDTRNVSSGAYAFLLRDNAVIALLLPSVGAGLLTLLNYLFFLGG